MDVKAARGELTPGQPEVVGFGHVASLGTEEHDGPRVRTRRVPLECELIGLRHGVQVDVSPGGAEQTTLGDDAREQLQPLAQIPESLPAVEPR